MNLPSEDKRLLEDLCQQHGMSADKVLKLLDTTAWVESSEVSRTRGRTRRHES